jgi:hypothetical protein
MQSLTLAALSLVVAVLAVVLRGAGAGGWG